MLQTIGVESVDDLFTDIPEAIRFQRELDIPGPYSELEVIRVLRSLNEMNASVDEYVSFLGAGAYNHFVPSVVRHLTSRGEFATAYTPYQPERSQGTLASLWIYASALSTLTGFEAINASLYDRSTCLFEALRCALRLVKGADTVIVSRAVYPARRESTVAVVPL